MKVWIINGHDGDCPWPEATFVVPDDFNEQRWEKFCAQYKEEFRGRMPTRQRRHKHFVDWLKEKIEQKPFETYDLF